MAQRFGTADRGAHLRNVLLHVSEHRRNAHVMLGVSFALVGGFWYMAILGYNMSIAVWVGVIALAGVAAETSAVMLAYLDGAYRCGSCR